MTLSKERLEHIAGLADRCGADQILGFVAEEVSAMATELLERRERDKQEITGWRALQNDNRDLREPLYLDGSNEPLGWSSDYAPVYSRAAPPAPVVQVPECFQRLLYHADGMRMGHDWNKGTMAGHHREALCKAVEDCRAAALNQTHVKQPASNGGQS